MCSSCRRPPITSRKRWLKFLAHSINGLQAKRWGTALLLKSVSNIGAKTAGAGPPAHPPPPPRSPWEGGRFRLRPTFCQFLVHIQDFLHPHLLSLLSRT